MLVKSNAFNCSYIFGQWLVMGLIAFMLSTFPVVGSAANSYIVGIVFLDANENGVHDPDEPVRSGHDVYLEDLTLISQGRGGNFYTVTDENGEFHFVVQSVGNYDISIELNDMRLTTPFFAVGFMPPHRVSITKAGDVAQVEFGLSGDTAGDLFIKNRDNSVIIYNEQYGLRVTPKAEGYDAKALTTMQIQQVEAETFTGGNNVAEVVLSPNYSTPLAEVSSGSTRKVRDSKDNFTVIIGQNISSVGEEGIFNVTQNADGSISLVNPQEPTVTTTLGTDGSYTVVDAEFPTHVVTADSSGSLVVSDSEFPDTVLSIDPNGAQAITDAEFPGVKLLINEDETYTIFDQELPELETIYNPNDGSYSITDTVEKITVLIDQSGNYTVIDNETGTCLAVPLTRGDFWKKVKGFFNKIAKFVAKVANFVGKVAKFIKKALPIVIKVLKVVSLVAGVLAPVFPPLCPVLCAISAFTGKAAAFLEASSPAINAFLDKTIDIAGKIEKGANTVAAWTEPKKDTKKKRSVRRGLRDSSSTIDRTHCISPPGLVLDYLVGAVQGSKNVLTWATVAEFDNQGFNVWRATEKNEVGELIAPIKVNAEMIPAKPDAQWGATYNFTDENIVPNQTYYYIVESIDSTGFATQQVEFVAEVKLIIGGNPVCQLYGVQDQASNNSYFFVHDLLKDTTHPLGEVCKGCDIEAMAIHPVTEEIFVASGDDAQGNPKGYLYKFNPETNKLIPIGATGFRGVTSLTFDQNGVLWAWAIYQGLGQIDPQTGEGTLLAPFHFEVGDLTWNTDKSALYASLGSQLWKYVPATGETTLACSNLPRKTEALAILPTTILPDGYLLLGSHRSGFQLHALDIASCQLVITRDIEVPYDDVEGLAISHKACVNF